MPPISVHFTLGLLATRLLVPRWFRPGDRGPVAIGVLAGAVVPDLDLIPSSLSFLVTFTTETGKLIHRTATHSYIVCAVLLAVGLLLLATWNGNPRKRAWGLGIAAAALSDALLHITPDMFYMVGVKFLFPLSLEEFHFGPLHKDRFTDAENNVINGVDFLSESAVWLFAAGLAATYGTANRLTRLLPTFALVNALFYLAVTVTLAPRMSYDGFLIVLYSVGLLNIVVSCWFLPFHARDTWLRFAKAEPAPRAASGREVWREAASR